MNSVIVSVKTVEQKSSERVWWTEQFNPRTDNGIVLQTSFVSATYPICVRAGSHSLLLANITYAQQIYSAMAIKSEHVIVWKVIMTVEAAGLRHWCETYNLLCLALLYSFWTMSRTCFTNHVEDLKTKCWSYGPDLPPSVTGIWSGAIPTNADWIR